MYYTHLALFAALSVATGNTSSARNNLRGGDGRKEIDGSPLNDIFSLALRDDESLPLLGPSTTRRAVQSTPDDDDYNLHLQSEYVQDCESFLFAQHVVDDGIISQNDFVDMLLHECRRLDVRCPHKGTLKFEQLDLSLQLKFIKGICHHEDMGDRFDCIHDLNEMWLDGNEFGFVTEGVDVDSLVHDMCFETYSDAAEWGFTSSSAPRAILSASPTQTPSFSPTKLPSRAPTIRPSRAPTNRPSRAPTIQPSYFPTRPAEPSINPTTSPARTPSLSPIHGPTASPTFEPTSISSLLPSIQPTSDVDDVTPSPISKRFADECTSYLLSPDFLEDGIISQTEFVRFLIHHCIQKGICDDRTIITFEELNVSLQLEFIFGVCSHDTQVGKAQCIDNLKTMWRDGNQFGFDVDADDLGLLVNEMCYMSHGYVLEMGLDYTAGPTEVQTLSPSTSPPVSDPPTVILQPLAPAPSHDSRTNLPSGRPSIFASKDTGDGNLEPPTSAPQSEDSNSRRAIIGSSAFVLCLTAACVVYSYHRPCQSSASSPDKHSSKDANRFGIAAHEPWGRSISSLPLSYMGLNCSLSSTSSSFRDYRFVNVFGPEGNPIPQFNPNTAGAVVIGSVTIGASSSISSGPFVNTSLAKSQSFFSIGKLSRRNDSPKSESDISSKDDMSSLSTNRSSYRKNPRYRAFNHRHPKTPIRLDAKNRVKSTRSTGTGPSRNSFPMSHKRRQKLERRGNCKSQLSFADWRAISYMTEFRHPSQATDRTAGIRQKSILFDALRSPPESQSRSSSPNVFSCQSLPNIRCGGSSDAGASSILSESYFQDSSFRVRGANSVTTSAHSDSTSRDRFVPWRKEGFNPSLRLSDKQSDGSGTSSAESFTPEPMKKLRLFRPAKSLFAKARMKTRAKDWFSFKHRQYHHLSKGSIALQEDPSVESMNASAHLLPIGLHKADLPNMPNIVLGTFAAATMPMQPNMLPKNPQAVSGYTVESSSHLNNAEGKETPAPIGTDAPSHPKTGTTETEDVQLEVATAEHPTSTETATATSPQVNLHISSLDANVSIEQNDESFCAYSRSDFESSAPSKNWSESSCYSSSTDSSQSKSTDSRQPKVLDCSFAAATAPLGGKLASHCVDDVSFLSNDTDHCDVNTLDDESKTVHLIGISQILSESESSEGSFPSSASPRRGEKESSILSQSCELAQNETNVMENCGKTKAIVVTPHSSGDVARMQFPPDEEDSVNHPEDCADLKIPEEKSVIISDDVSQVSQLVEAAYEKGAVNNPGTVENSVIVPDDLSMDDSTVNTWLVGKKEVEGVSLSAPEKAVGLNALSISLSWDSEVCSTLNSIGTIELDASFASTIRVENTAK